MAHDEQRVRGHVTRGREIAEGQRKLIETIRASGKPTAEREKLLTLFEGTLAIFEANLSGLSARRKAGHSGEVCVAHWSALIIPQCSRWMY